MSSMKIVVLSATYGLPTVICRQHHHIKEQL